MRRSEDVLTFLAQAKLDCADLTHVVQPISFTNGQDGDLMLMEIDKSLLNDLQGNEMLTFKGRDDDGAVLCTSKCTYEVREAETSNSLLLVPELQFPSDISTEGIDSTLTISPKRVPRIFNTYLELRPCCSRLRALYYLLQRKPFGGTELEDDDLTDKYTLNDLLSMVQATEDEILSALKELPVVKINGFYRLLEVDYHFRVVNFIVDYTEAESIPIEKIPMEDVVGNVSELVPREIATEVFLHCTVPSTDQGFYSLNRDYICRLTAQAILKNVDKFNLAEFMELWQKSVPEGIQVDLSQLGGLALTDHSSIPESIFLFDKWEMPQEASERLNVLFRRKEKWTIEEIRPYIEDLCAGPKGDINTLLMKCARAFVENGIRRYAAKHPTR